MTDKDLLKHAITRIATLSAKIDQLNTVIGKQASQIKNLEGHIDHILDKERTEKQCYEP